jgi:polyphenol oxidase
MPSIDVSQTVQAEALSKIAGVRHAFFTRCGGVSSGIYESLNAGIGSHDEAESVHENRDRAMRFLGRTSGELATPWQVHSAEAVRVEAPFGAERPRADAVVTATPGLVVGVVTADCGPILFADARAGVVGAAHAGWRGALKGVLGSTVAAMEDLGARRQDIVAVLGPCITQANYEVGAEMMAEFLAGNAGNERFFAPGAAPGKQQFDLPGFILSQLGALDVEPSFVGRCTYGEPDEFFSYRRTTHHGETDYGRQLSAIVLG